MPRSIRGLSLHNEALSLYNKVGVGGTRPGTRTPSQLKRDDTGGV